jgi:hypothetical protein
MLRAFDTILQTEVSASLAAQNGGFEQYRYECACCGEEAFVAAYLSKKQSVHFRHRNGNNDVKCQNYLGQFGMLRAGLHSKRSNRERAEFYFDYTNKTFNIGLRFNENEIQGYEEHGVDFELRARESEKPFTSIKINSLNFTPDVPTIIPLTRFAYNYYVSNTGNDLKRKYSFCNRNIPTFFKILGNEGIFKARLVRSETIYTNTRYFMVFQSQWSVYTAYDGMEISETFRFETMGYRFAGVVIKILKKTEKVETLINTWGYQLEDAETLTLLWPPVSLCDDVAKVYSDSIFLHTSFTLQAHGNISVSPNEIKRLSENVSKISVNDKIRVFRKNAEVLIARDKNKAKPCSDINVLIETAGNFTVPNDISYFIVNIEGAIPLSVGQHIFLTRHSQIKGYYSGYLLKIVRPHQRQELSGEKLLADIIAHNKRTEPFNVECFNTLSLSDSAMEYIFECEASGVINSVAKQYILEGKL